MNRSRAVLWLGALLVGVPLAVLSPRAAGLVPAQFEQAQDPGSALLIGTVVDGVTGKALGGAVVSINATPIPGAAPVAPGAAAAPTSVLTGPDGRFLFARLKAGTYNVDGEKGGYIRGGLNSVRPGMSGGGVVLQAGEHRTDLVLKIWRAASLGGVVIDDGGEPAIGVEVRFVRRLVAAGRTIWSPAGISTVRTDDRGMYRVAGVTPGDYIAYIPVTQVTMPTAVIEEYQKGSSAQTDTSRAIMTQMIGIGGGMSMGVMASGPGMPGVHQVGDNVVTAADGMPSPTNTEGGPTFAYATTYYPASSSLAGATQIKLASGDERYDVNFNLRPVRTINISGTLMGPDGPIPLTRVSLTPAGTSGLAIDLDGAATISNSTGAFTLLNVPQGQYTLRVLRVPQLPRTPMGVTTVVLSGGGATGMTMMSGGPSATPPLPPDPVLWAELPIGAGNEDIKGLVVSARTGIRVQGRVEFVGSAAQPDEKQMATVNVRLAPADGRGSSNLAATRVSGTGELTSQGFAPGRYFVNASYPVPTQGWSLASIMHGGIDVSQTPLELTSGDVSDLIVTFTDHRTMLSGTVRDATGNPDPGAVALAFPADSPIVADEPTNARRVRTARATSAGRFTFTNLPPGDYFIVGIPADEDRWSEPQFLQQLKAQAARVKLAYDQPATTEVVIRKVR